MLPMVRTLVLAAALAAVPGAALAQTPATPAAPHGPRGPFQGGGGFGVEFAGTLMTEAWNQNGSHEWVGDGSLAIWWGFKPGQAIIAEFHVTPVFQDRPRNAFVNGFTPTYRWRFYEKGPTSLYGEIGLGVSWSDTQVPERGTRFNFMTAMSVGAMRRLGSQSHLVASFRWMHLSNASRFGRDHNPDIEALGGYFGINFGF